MKVVIQRTKESNVKINGKVVGSINCGLTLLTAFTHSDTKEVVDKVINKIVNMRIFEDESGKMNKSLLDINGEILNISQFTLYANIKNGRRPSFTNAMDANEATKLYDYMNEKIKSLNLTCEVGVFGADMKVFINNDGPVTIILDSSDL